MIGAERRRQIEAEGYRAGFDAGWTQRQLAEAAWCYLTAVLDPEFYPPGHWPWEDHAWKPTPSDPIRQLVKAGALIAAEIDRLSAQGGV